jgi:hypothetical protein
VYRRNGVQEYVLWRVLDGTVEWFALQAGQYVVLPPDERGVVLSTVFPGLRLAIPALLAGDLAAVLAAQHAAFGQDEHRTFVERLAATPGE